MSCTDNCRFFRERDNHGGYAPIGYCHRFPRTEPISSFSHWCGEYKKTQEEVLKAMEKICEQVYGN